MVYTLIPYTKENLVKILLIYTLKRHINLKVVDLVKECALLFEKANYYNTIALAKACLDILLVLSK